MIRNFLRDSLIYGAATIISQGLAFFLVPLYTRVLPPGDYGALDMLLIFGNFANLTVALEVSQGLARHYSDASTKEAKQNYASTAFWFTLGMFTLFTVACLFFAGSINNVLLGKKNLLLVFRLGLIFIFLNGLFYLIQNQFRWELRSREYAVVSILYSLTTICGAVILAYWMQLGIKGVLLGQILGAAFGTMAGLWLLRKTFCFQFDIIKLKEMLKFSIPLVPSSISMFVNLYIDRILLKYFKGLYEVGIYGVGYRVASIVMFVTIIVQGSLTPLVYAHYKESETPDNLARIFRWFIAIALLLSLSVGLFAKEVLWVLTTPAYYEASSIVIILAPSILLWRMSIFVPGISISKKTYWEVVISVCAALLNFALTYTLIPLLGILGAALAILISSFTYFLMYLIISQHFYRVPHVWRPLVVGSLIACLIGGLGYLVTVSPITDIAIKTALLLSFFFIVIALGLIQLNEITRAFSMVKVWFTGTAK